jgi:predicted nucleic acid-binding protein
VITRAELFAGSSATEAIVRLLAPFREIDVDRDIAERAGRIRRETGVRPPDALIAATALERKLGLATRNERDFTPVRGIRIRKLG